MVSFAGTRGNGGYSLICEVVGGGLEGVPKQLQKAMRCTMLGQLSRSEIGSCGFDKLYPAIGWSDRA